MYHMRTTTTAAWKQLSATLEEISAAARVRQWKFGRSGKGRGGGKVEEYESGNEGPRYAGTETGEA